MFHVRTDTACLKLGLPEWSLRQGFLCTGFTGEVLSGEGSKPRGIAPGGKGRQEFGLSWRLASV